MNPQEPTSNTPNGVRGVFDYRTRRKNLRRCFFFVLCLALIVLVYETAIMSPRDFKPQTIFKITQGENLKVIAGNLLAAHIIRSKEAFEIFTMFFGSDQHITDGDYYFESPVSTIEVARRIGTGDHHLIPIRMTLPEGLTRNDMAKILQTKLPQFDSNAFLSDTKDKEGYLFPDTYFFFPLTTSAEVVSRLFQAFEKALAPLEPDILASGKTKEDIITMASLVEKEAAGSDDRATIAGILWKRIALGMPLQVDASFLFINGKSSSELTEKDLQIDSPYNTYKYKGLPPGPICNPGLLAIKGALYPTETPYFFYLHDKNGMIHYAKTFDEHKKNKALYL